MLYGFAPIIASDSSSSVGAGPVEIIGRSDLGSRTNFPNSRDSFAPSDRPQEDSPGHSYIQERDDYRVSSPLLGARGTG